MENKTARMTVLVDPIKKQAFDALCASQDLTSSQVLRQLMRDYMENFGVDYSTRSHVGTRKFEATPALRGASIPGQPG